MGTTQPAQALTAAVGRPGHPSLLLTSWGWSKLGGKWTCHGPYLPPPFLPCDLDTPWALYTSVASTKQMGAGRPPPHFVCVKAFEA